MKIRRYTCNDMQEAMLKVKMDLGSEAVIMNSRKVKKKGLFGLFSKPMIEVVAAIDDDYVRPARSAPRHSQVSTDGLPPLYREPNRETFHQAPPVYQQPVNYPPPHNPYAQPQAAHMQQAVSEEARPPAQSQINPQMQNQAPVEPKPEEDKKIIELESKVKSMESMLEQIYKAVNDKSGSSKEAPEPTETQPLSSPAAEKDGMTILRNVLIDFELDMRLIEKVLEKVKERGGNQLKNDEIFAIAAKVLVVLLGEPETISLRSDGKPQVVIFIGPTGVGKTTTLAKIAADFTLNKQKKVGLITADTYRIAAVEQLKTYAEILNIPVTIVYSPNEIQDAVKRLSDKDLILIDTAGRSHKNKSHFDELKTLVSSAGADETFLVLSANTSKAAAREILEYYSFIKNCKLLFTKLDEAPVPGLIINARYMTGKPLSYTTAGQSVPDDLDVANAKAIVSTLMGTKTNI